MKIKFGSKEFHWIWLVSFLIPFFLFWLILLFRIPESFSRFFHAYSLPLFLIILVLYCVSFQLSDRFGIVAALSLTMALTALALSYIWSSGFSDNFIISGLIPYKDAKNYFAGAELLLNGFPLVGADQATERPLFPSFLASILLLTGQNLKIALGIITQLVALGIYFSARQIQTLFGGLAASVFAALLYFYVQPFIGYSMSEALGVLAGCFGFTMMWLASHNLKWSDLVLGVLVLLIAVSARAGAFFIFPLLVLWVGWIFRGEKRLSLKMAAYALIGVVIGYFLVNTIYSRLLGIPPGSSFGNFSYALYGQVRGGTGWHSAVEDLGTRNPSIVYREAWQFFRRHPISLFIGFAKSYRDFFSLGGGSMFPFGNFDWQNWPNIIVWVIAMIFLVAGLIQSLRTVRNNHSSLLLAGFVGIFLSIPFLPPIDGGSRFYAGTALYFFVLPALGAGLLSGIRQPQSPSTNDNWRHDLTASRYFSIAILVLTLILPPLIRSFAPKPALASPSCPPGHEPFFIEYHKGSYVDLAKPGSASCGFVPEVCQEDFERNNTEKSIDDFYETLLTSMENDVSDVRIIPAIDFVNHKFHYFYTSPEEFAGSLSSGAISGCAAEVLTKNQTIYQVESWSPEEN